LGRDLAKLFMIKTQLTVKNFQGFGKVFAFVTLLFAVVACKPIVNIITPSPTLPPPFPTPPTIFIPTTTPAISELSGYVVFDDITHPDSFYQIFIENLNTREIQQLTFIGSNAEPVWSPNGKQIAFSSNRNEKDNIYVMNSDGSNQQPLTQCSGSTYSPTWSPDGNNIAFVSDCNNNQDKALYVLDVTTRNLTRLTQDNVNYLDPNWSPDGKQIAFAIEQENSDGATQVYTIDLNGLEIKQLIPTKATARRPVWCPDNTCVIYEMGTQKRFRIPKLMVMDLKSKETRPFLPSEIVVGSDINVWLPSLSPRTEYVTFSISNMLYAMNLKEKRLYSLGLQSFGGSLYP
jgi:Tol biopolymer transport system component